MRQAQAHGAALAPVVEELQAAVQEAAVMNLVLLASMALLLPLPTDAAVASRPAPGGLPVPPSSRATAPLSLTSWTLLRGPSGELSPTTRAVSRRGPMARTVQQEGLDLATLETVRPEVQWSPAGAFRWVSVPRAQAVQEGDRARTGIAAAARLVYAEGSVTELGPETGILVQRLERTPNDSMVVSLLQTIGSTVHHLRQLLDPAASFEVETPASTARVRGTTPAVQVANDGRTRVENIPDGTGGLVEVQGKDPGRTVVILRPGEATEIVPGQAPSSPTAISSGSAQEQAPAGESQTPQQQAQLWQQVQQAQQQGAAQLAAVQAAAAYAQEMIRAVLWQQVLNQLLSGATATSNPAPSPTIGPGIPTLPPSRTATGVPTLGPSRTATAPTAPTATGIPIATGTATSISVPSPTAAVTATTSVTAVTTVTATTTATPTTGVTATATSLPLPSPTPTPTATPLTQASATSSAVGELVALTLVPTLGPALSITSGPSPRAAGAAPPPYAVSNSAASITVSTPLTGQILNTSTLAVDAAATVPTNNTVSASAILNDLSVNLVGALPVSARLLTLDAASVQASAQLAGPCGGPLLATGTTTITSGTVGGTLGVAVAIPANPAPNTVLLDTAGVRLVLNEQILGGDGIRTRSLTVNAIHLTLTNVALPGIGTLSGEVLLSQAQGQLTCLPS